MISQSGWNLLPFKMPASFRFTVTWTMAYGGHESGCYEKVKQPYGWMLYTNDALENMN